MNPVSGKDPFLKNIDPINHLLDPGKPSFEVEEKRPLRMNLRPLGLEAGEPRGSPRLLFIHLPSSRDVAQNIYNRPGQT